jgi:hypothetical protein
VNPKLKPKFFYWLEGVSGKSVRRHLDAPEITLWHRRRTRRNLVILQSLVIAALALLWLLPSSIKAQTYFEFVLLGSALALYFLLRKSIRLLADAPDELLDERQIGVRDGGYTRAYRLLALSTVLYVVIYIALDTRLERDPTLMIEQTVNPWLSFGLSYAMLAASLPAMTLAWTLPDESA